MPSAKNVADAAPGWADANLPSLGSVWSICHWRPVRDAKRPGEVAKYLGGLDHLVKKREPQLAGVLAKLPLLDRPRNFSRALCGERVFEWRGAVEQA